MDCFNYSNIQFYINDIVLLKYKSRILKYIITTIQLKNNDYYIISFKNSDDEQIIKTVKFIIGTTNKYIKKYFIYTEPPKIQCKLLKSKHIVYKFHCDFCNEIHKHNYLGHNDFRCGSMYSPYSNTGYDLELNLNMSNFNEYLLYNLELYLLKINFGGWSSYKLSVKKFYEGKVCKDYGKNSFPYITPTTLEYIRINYKEDNLKCSNGCLVSGLNSIMKMVLSKTILYVDESYKTDINKLYKFYKKNCKITKSNTTTLDKLHKIKLLRKILNTYKPMSEEKSEEKKCITKSEESKIESKMEKKIEYKIDELIKTENTEELIKTTNTEEFVKEDLPNIDIKLDLDCGMEQIETLSDIHINNIKQLIYEDSPEYKDKYFYLPNDVKLYSAYFDSYEDLWLCMYKLETPDKYTVYCVDEVDIYDPDFINYRLERRERL